MSHEIAALQNQHVREQVAYAILSLVPHKSLSLIIPPEMLDFLSSRFEFQTPVFKELYNQWFYAKFAYDEHGVYNRQLQNAYLLAERKLTEYYRSQEIIKTAAEACVMSVTACSKTLALHWQLPSLSSALTTTVLFLSTVNAAAAQPFVNKVFGSHSENVTGGTGVGNAPPKEPTVFTVPAKTEEEIKGIHKDQKTQNAARVNPLEKMAVQLHEEMILLREMLRELHAESTAGIAAEITVEAGQKKTLEYLLPLMVVMAKSDKKAFEEYERKNLGIMKQLEKDAPNNYLASEALGALLVLKGEREGSTVILLMQALLQNPHGLNDPKNFYIRGQLLRAMGLRLQKLAPLLVRLAEDKRQLAKMLSEIFLMKDFLVMYRRYLEKMGDYEKDPTLKLKEISAIIAQHLAAIEDLKSGFGIKGLDENLVKFRAEAKALLKSKAAKKSQGLQENSAPISDADQKRYLEEVSNLANMNKAQKTAHVQYWASRGHAPSSRDLAKAHLTRNQAIYDVDYNPALGEKLNKQAEAQTRKSSQEQKLPSTSETPLKKSIVDFRQTYLKLYKGKSAAVIASDVVSPESVDTPTIMSAMVFLEKYRHNIQEGMRKEPNIIKALEKEAPQSYGASTTLALIHTLSTANLDVAVMLYVQAFIKSPSMFEGEKGRSSLGGILGTVLMRLKQVLIPLSKIKQEADYLQPSNSLALEEAQVLSGFAKQLYQELKKYHHSQDDVSVTLQQAEEIFTGMKQWPTLESVREKLAQAQKAESQAEQSKTPHVPVITDEALKDTLFELVKFYKTQPISQKGFVSRKEGLFQEGKILPEVMIMGMEVGANYGPTEQEAAVGYNAYLKKHPQIQDKLFTEATRGNAYASYLLASIYPPHQPEALVFAAQCVRKPDKKDKAPYSGIELFLKVAQQRVDTLKGNASAREEVAQIEKAVKAVSEYYAQVKNPSLPEKPKKAVTVEEIVQEFENSAKTDPMLKAIKDAVDNANVGAEVNIRKYFNAQVKKLNVPRPEETGINVSPTTEGNRYPREVRLEVGGIKSDPKNMRVRAALAGAMTDPFWAIELAELYAKDEVFPGMGARKDVAEVLLLQARLLAKSSEVDMVEKAFKKFKVVIPSVEEPKFPEDQKLIVAGDLVISEFRKNLIALNMTSTEGFADLVKVTDAPVHPSIKLFYEMVDKPSGVDPNEISQFFRDYPGFQATLEHEAMVKQSAAASYVLSVMAQREGLTLRGIILLTQALIQKPHDQQYKRSLLKIIVFRLQKIFEKFSGVDVVLTVEEYSVAKREIDCLLQAAAFESLFPDETVILWDSGIGSTLKKEFSGYRTQANILMSLHDVKLVKASNHLIDFFKAKQVTLKGLMQKPVGIFFSPSSRPASVNTAVIKVHTIIENTSLTAEQVVMKLQQFFRANPTARQELEVAAEGGYSSASYVVGRLAKTLDKNLTSAIMLVAQAVAQFPQEVKYQDWFLMLSRTRLQELTTPSVQMEHRAEIELLLETNQFFLGYLAGADVKENVSNQLAKIREQLKAFEPEKPFSPAEARKEFDALLTEVSKKYSSEELQKMGVTAALSHEGRRYLEEEDVRVKKAQAVHMGLQHQDESVESQNQKFAQYALTDPKYALRMSTVYFIGDGVKANAVLGRLLRLQAILLVHHEKPEEIELFFKMVSMHKVQADNIFQRNLRVVQDVLTPELRQQFDIFLNAAQREPYNPYTLAGFMQVTFDELSRLMGQYSSFILKPDYKKFVAQKPAINVLMAMNQFLLTRIQDIPMDPKNSQSSQITQFCKIVSKTQVEFQKQIDYLVSTSPKKGHEDDYDWTPNIIGGALGVIMFIVAYFKLVYPLFNRANAQPDARRRIAEPPRATPIERVVDPVVDAQKQARGSHEKNLKELEALRNRILKVKQKSEALSKKSDAEQAKYEKTFIEQCEPVFIVCDQILEKEYPLDKAEELVIDLGALKDYCATLEGFSADQDKAKDLDARYKNALINSQKLKDHLGELVTVPACIEAKKQPLVAEKQILETKKAEAEQKKDKGWQKIKADCVKEIKDLDRAISVFEKTLLKYQGFVSKCQEITEVAYPLGRTDELEKVISDLNKTSAELMLIVQENQALAKQHHASQKKHEEHEKLVRDNLVTECNELQATLRAEAEQLRIAIERQCTQIEDKFIGTAEYLRGREQLRARSDHIGRECEALFLLATKVCEDMSHAELLAHHEDLVAKRSILDLKHALRYEFESLYVELSRREIKQAKKMGNPFAHDNNALLEDHKDKEELSSEENSPPKPPLVRVDSRAKMVVVAGQEESVETESRPVLSKVFSKKNILSGVGFFRDTATGQELMEYKKSDFAVESEFQRELTPAEIMRLEKQRRQAMIGWMAKPIEYLLDILQTHVNESDEDYRDHPLIGFYSLLYVFHQLQLLQMHAYDFREAVELIEIPPLFREPSVGDLATDCWGLLVHSNIFAHRNGRLPNREIILDCVRKAYMSEQEGVFVTKMIDENIHKTVRETDFYRMLVQGEEDKNYFSAVGLVTALKQAFDDLMALEKYIQVEQPKVPESLLLETQKQRFMPSYLAACKMVLVAFGQLDQDFDKLKKRNKDVKRVISHPLFKTTLKKYLAECHERVRNLERHEKTAKESNDKILLRLLDMKQDAESARRVGIAVFDNTPANEVEKFVQAGREIVKAPGNEELFDNLLKIANGEVVKVKIEKAKTKFGLGATQPAAVAPKADDSAKKSFGKKK